MESLPIIAEREVDGVELADLRLPQVARRGDRAQAIVRRYRAYVLPILYAGTAIRHWQILSRFLAAPSDSLLATTVAARPEIWSMLRVRFVSARWGTRERLMRIVDHCTLAEGRGAPFDLAPNQRATLTTLDEIGPNVRVTLDSPRWLVREGLLALSIMDGGDRIFSISFTLGEQDGMPVAYVGGIQGRRAADALARNRDLTKAAAGARPQDLLVELFRSLCLFLRVRRILCVSAGIRNGQTAFARDHVANGDPVRFDYDALWTERGGSLRADGFFDLPLVAPVRDESEVPAKKRQARRRKLALIAAAQLKLSDALAFPEFIDIDQIEPA